MSKRIYLADDDENIRTLMTGFLAREGYEVQGFENGEALLLQFQKEPADLVILDVMMPGPDGFHISRSLRKSSAVPIIMVTARDAEQDLVRGIEAGSDDYITKPFSPRTLTMKVGAMLRRIQWDRGGGVEGTLSFLDIELQPDRKQVFIKGEAVDLAPNEYALLKYLMEHQDRAISREELLDQVWGYTTPVETRVTDDTLKRLRKKIAHAAAQIETVWGFGFRMSPRG